MTGHPDVTGLRRELDALYQRAGLLERGVLSGTTLGRAIALQTVHFAAQGLVTVTDGATVRRTGTNVPALSEGAGVLFRALFVHGASATFAAGLRGTGVRATWSRLRVPVSREVEDQLYRAGLASRWATSRLRVLENAGKALVIPFVAGLFVLMADPLAGAVMELSVYLAVPVGFLVYRRIDARRGLTPRGMRFNGAGARVALLLHELLNQDDPLPADQASLDFYEQALPLALLHDLGEKWQDRMRAHHARDTSRRSTLLTVPPTDYVRLVDHIEDCVHGVLPYDNGSQ